MNDAERALLDSLSSREIQALAAGKDNFDRLCYRDALQKVRESDVSIPRAVKIVVEAVEDA